MVHVLSPLVPAPVSLSVVSAPLTPGKEKPHRKGSCLSSTFRNYLTSRCCWWLPQPSTTHSPSCILTLRAARIGDSVAASAPQCPGPTCPSCLVSEDKRFALGVAVTDLNGFIDIKHREEAALVMVGWPASVVLIRNEGFRHPPVLCKSEQSSGLKAPANWLFLTGKVYWNSLGEGYTTEKLTG